MTFVSQDVLISFQSPERIAHTLFRHAMRTM